jgi:16S rRNA processing protein RimM
VERDDTCCGVESLGSSGESDMTRQHEQAEHAAAGSGMNIDEMVILGRISGVHGVKGWVKVFSYTDPMESIVDYSPWYIRPEHKKAQAWQKIKLTSGRRQAKTVIAKLEHCNDRDTAMAYVGYEVAITAEQLAETAENEYYWRDLIGLRVINHNGVDLGVVKSLMETGSNDVLVVYSDEQQRERLVPWTPGLAVTNVDTDEGVIEVDWDENF